MGAILLSRNKMKACCWLKPRLVVAMDFLEWTQDERLRHPSFVALRANKVAKEIVSE